MIPKLTYPRNYFWSYSRRTPIFSMISPYNIQSNGCWSGVIMVNTGGVAIIDSGLIVGPDPWDLDLSNYDSRTILPANTAGTYEGFISSSSDSERYIRAYVVTPFGTYYSWAAQFITPPIMILPDVQTALNNDIYQTYADIGYGVNSEGDTPVTAHGVVWSTSEFPNLNDNYTVEGTGLGGFVSTISPLIPDTTYYVRAYATNSGGTSYGNQVEIKTQHQAIQFESSGVINGGTGTTVSIPFPSTVNANDTLIMLVANKSVASFTDPSGWTRIAQFHTTTMAYTVFHKIATGSESGNQSLNLSVSAQWGGIILRYSGATSYTGAIGYQTLQGISRGTDVRGNIGNLGLIFWIINSEVTATNNGATGWVEDFNLAGSGFTFVAASYLFGSSPSSVLTYPNWNSFQGMAKVTLT